MDHPSFARVWRGLGTVLLDAGKLDEARQALGASRAVSAGLEESPWPSRVDVMLAEIDRRQGLFDDAMTRLKAAEGKFGDDPSWSQRWAEEMAKLTESLKPR